MTKLVIKNGTVIDGTGKAAFKADIAVIGSIIDGIGSFDSDGFDQVIDAGGMVVCPGFIDTHSHSDIQILVDPMVEPKVRQGVTTEVLGQDGLSAAPLPIRYINTWRKNLAGLDGDSDLIDWTFGDTAGYLKMLEEVKPSLNECYLVPHGNIRMEGMGLDNRPATETEMRRMCDILRREMEAGAIGMSTGLIYIPCAYAPTEEIIELCRVVAEYDGVFVVHQRSEADAILESMAEIMRIGRETGVRIHFSHMKLCGRKNWDKMGKVLEYLDKAKEEGIRVSFDQYPYVAGSTMLGVILPPWAHDGGTEALLNRLKDPEARRRMIYDIEHGIPGWDNFVDFAGLDQIFITSVKTSKNQDLIGKNLIEVGEIRGKDPYEATFDLLLEEENAVGMFDFYGTEEHVVQFMKRSEQNVCTDGLLGGKPHPRVYGSYPRVLGRYVREKKALSLVEAIYKMTGKAAEAMRIKRRGVLKEGNYADLVIFDPDTIIDRGDFVDPIRYPEGIASVIVNGQPILKEGERTAVRPGRIIRRSDG